MGQLQLVAALAGMFGGLIVSGLHLSAVFLGNNTLTRKLAWKTVVDNLFRLCSATVGSAFMAPWAVEQFGWVGTHSVGAMAFGIGIGMFRLTPGFSRRVRKATRPQ